MVGCVLVMAPTGLECTQDMRNGTVANGGATSPREGGQASHRRRALVLQPTDATSGAQVPRPYAHRMERPRGDWVDGERHTHERTKKKKTTKSKANELI